MLGAERKLIAQQGETYTVRNASGGDGGRDLPSYSDDGTLVGVIRRSRGAPQPVPDSAGEDVTPDFEIRAVPDSSVTITPAGTADSYPTKLVGPGGRGYRVLDEVTEDGGVTVLPVVRD